MPLRRVIPRKSPREFAEPMPHIAHLPAEYDWLAQASLRNSGATADSILLLADALEEVADHAYWHGEKHPTVAAVRELVTELRRRAPGYA